MEQVESGKQLAVANNGAALPERQKAVLELICAGTSVAEAARKVEVTRQTIYRWIKCDPMFQAAYNQWHEEMEESSRSQLAMMTEAATAAVRQALERGDAKMGMQLLKGLGLIAPAKRRATDVDEIMRRKTLEEKRLANELADEERWESSTTTNTKIQETYKMPETREAQDAAVWDAVGRLPEHDFKRFMRGMGIDPDGPAKKKGRKKGGGVSGADGDGEGSGGG
jgi:transposase-like protein